MHSAFRGMNRGLAVAGLWLLFLPAASGIIIRDDLPDSDYVVADSDYPALVDLIERGDCTATLVHESYLLTVAHCAAEVNAGKVLQVNGVAHTVAEVILHPQWNRRRDEYDIALVRLSEPVKGVTPLPIYRGPEETGSLITLVGRGDSGTGVRGERGASNDGKLRKCTNIVSQVNDHFIEIFFERPGEKGVTALEGVGAAGDSGGPAFIEVDGVSYIAGLNSWGDGPRGVRVGQYGAYDYQTRVTQYLEWLDSVVDFPDPPAVRTALSILNLSPIFPPFGSVENISLTFSTAAGKSYLVEESPDLVRWRVRRSRIRGTGTPVRIILSAESENRSALFWRVREE